MHARERCAAALRGLVLATAAAAATVATVAAAADDPPFRHRAVIELQQPAALVRLPLTPEVYARSKQPGLADLRIVDARGTRVPFAVLEPRADEWRASEETGPAALYPLPAQAMTGGAAEGHELTIEGGRVTLRTGRGAGAAKAAADAAARPSSATGYLIDLGEAKTSTTTATDTVTAVTRKLRLQWDGTASFSAGATLAHSADLKQWRPATGGQLSQITPPAGSGLPALLQQELVLPTDAGRYLRLHLNADSGSLPTLRAAQSVRESSTSVTHEAPQRLSLAPSAEPAADAKSSATSLHFDLGAVLPIVDIELAWPAGTRVLPVQVQLRDRADAPWQNATGTVFYRLERADGVARPPPLALASRPARFVRLRVDDRAALPATDAPQLQVRVRLASLVFSAQGEAPLTLRAGATRPATAGALPLATLVPDLAQERPRLGRASLGPWQEEPAAAASEQRASQIAALRPWLLWALLIGGVAALALMVWRLVRTPRTPTASS